MMTANGGCSCIKSVVGCLEMFLVLVTWRASVRPDSRRRRQNPSGNCDVLPASSRWPTCRYEGCSPTACAVILRAKISVLDFQKIASSITSVRTFAGKSMSQNRQPMDSSAEVEVQLLDPTVGLPIKSWRFTGQSVISIGRMDDCAVEVLDPHVSRLHATLSLCDGKWVLTALGRNGVLVDGHLISEIPVQKEITFRLGPLGPSVRFNVAAEKEDAFLQTLCFDPDTMPFFQLDQSKLQDEVTEIASEDFFQTLQKKAKDLRRQREET